MAQEDKELLLIDLCARKPHGLKYQANGKLHTLQKIDGRFIDSEMYTLEEVKPYLRPLSSMTEEEKADYHFYCETVWDSAEESYYYYDTFKSIDWLNEHHFDYRGLIPMGLALEAPEDMYKIG
ncbi:MAG: hypothetical protein J6Y37_01730 [Paludibacteraceae bacterium]|nr:hypothetical protein [Paludibacteraceae bacterium]